MAAAHAAAPGVVYALINKSCALYKKGRVSDAGATLREALSYAVADRVYMPFAELYAGIEPVLKSIVLEGEEQRAAAEIARLGRMQAQGVRAVRAALLPGEGSLTAREKQISYLTAQGMTAGEIAQALFLSEQTVKNTLRNVYSKLGIHKKRELRDKIGRLFSKN